MKTAYVVVTTYASLIVVSVFFYKLLVSGFLLHVF